MIPMQEYEKEHLKVMRARLAECTLFLKKNGAFPLDGPCRIAAYGSGVRYTVRGGTGSGEVNVRFARTIEQALKKAGFSLQTEDWLDACGQIRRKAQKEFAGLIRKEARERHEIAAFYGMGRVMPEPEYDMPLRYDCDAAVYVLSRISGEGNDRRPVPGDLLLTESEIRDIRDLDRHYDKFLLVINAGGPVDLSPVKETGNILVLSQLGSLTGTVFADILLGRANPSGKLTASWSAWEDRCPDLHFGDPDDTYYREGIYVGYRWFDTVGKKADYPFGFGLSYTDFSVAPENVSVSGEEITVSVSVKNTGNAAGKEVVQLYVSCPQGKLDKPYQDLAAFVKTDLLQPGESRRTELRFRLSDLASYDEEQAVYILEKGTYLLRAGSDSVHTRPAARILLKEDAVIRKVRPITDKTDFRDRTYRDRPETMESSEETVVLPLAEIPPDCFSAKETVYDADETDSILPEIRALSDKELLYLAMGAFDPKAGVLHVIGDASLSVAGAAGETTALLKEKGIGTLTMADGPAGLRLAPVFYRDAKGAHAVGQGGIPESVKQFLPPGVRLLADILGGGKRRIPRGAEAEYQFATSLPVGTALAQSWNTAFAEKCGDIAGDEMVRMGIRLWLAPAMNIQRSVLCGRNFEYYSEDPLLSGKMAAAVTRGVQKHPGCGTTIKHFAANNQETNRMHSCSHVSERALREIYLKGFAICVREAQPHAVMTSYNLINGTHTAESRGLIQDYLRAENGFAGIVMTDWMISLTEKGKVPHYRGTDAGASASAGGDLFMPGSAADFRQMAAALKTGTLTRQQLEISGSRVLREIGRGVSRMSG